MFACPKRAHTLADEAVECERCGVVVAKARRAAPRTSGQLLRKAAATPTQDTDPPDEPRRGLLTDTADPGPIMFGGRVFMLLLTLYWAVDVAGHSAASPDTMNSYLHGIHLVFHEAGHLIFAVFGDFMRVLGGSLMQVLMPLLFVGAFIWRRNAFGAAICLWWTGHSLADLAPYIADAAFLDLPLLGGITGMDAPGYHDWQNLLRRFSGAIRKAPVYGQRTHIAGVITMFTSIAWGLEVLRRQWKRREDGLPPFLRRDR